MRIGKISGVFLVIVIVVLPRSDGSSHVSRRVLDDSRHPDTA